MKIEALILSTLSLLATGCSSTFGCDPPDEKFTVDAKLTEQEVLDIMKDWGFNTREEITCDDLCSFAYRRDRQWEIGDIETCTHTIGAPGDSPTQEVGTITCGGVGYEYICEGRRPIGHIEATAVGNSLGDYLARCAHLEAASVVAFEGLASQLEQWDAPAELIERCRRAAADETRHAQQIGAHAERHGAEVPPAAQNAVSPTRLEVAIDNATEGCVYEAWAALRASWTGNHARDPELRRLYAKIAVDEAEHAQLAWDLHRWLIAGLSPLMRARVEQAMREAIARLPEIAESGATRPAELGDSSATQWRSLAERFGKGLTAAA